MQLKKIPILAGMLALVCAVPAFGQSLSSIAVKNATFQTVNVAGQLDASNNFHYRDVMEGLDGSGNPVAANIDPSTHDLIVQATALPLPTGAATAANQTAAQSAPGTPQTTAMTVQGNASGVPVPVSAAALPLPSGAATSAAQTSAQTSLSSIDTKTPALNGDGGSPAHISGGSISNTSFGISGTLPGFASPPTVNLGTLNGAALDASVGTTNTDIGAPGSTVCATDTGSCALNAQLQRTLQKLTSLITALGTPMQASGGSVTANAGTNLNTSLLALESGGNLANLYAAMGNGGSPAANTLQARLATLITTLGSPFQAGGSIGNTSFASPASPTITGPTSTLTLPATTTAYTANQLIANSATAGSVVVPSFAIANSAGGAIITGLRLSTNDSTSTAWGTQTIQVDLWLAAPTFTNGDRGAFSPATGTANHLRTFSCTMSAEYGDGTYAECAPVVGNFSMPKLASGTSVFWTLSAVTGSGVTGASKVWTITAETLN